MSYLSLLSRTRQRYAAIKRQMPQYWLDALVEQYRRERAAAVQVVGTVLGVLRQNELQQELVIPGVNIVTNDGDTYYAQSIAAETPTDDFDAAAAGLRLGTGSTAPTKTDTDVTTENSAGRHALDATYERTADPDADNTGAGADIVTWRYSYLTSEGNITNIAEGAIVDNRTTPTAALTHFLFAAAFTKTSADTLKVFVNHTLNGV